MKKYRIWDKENNCWYEPTYRAYQGELEDLTLTPAGELIMRTMDECAIHESKFKNRFEVVFFTGLKDKTRTKEFPEGKEIWEGDKLRCTHPNDEFIHGGVVEYDNESACYLLNRGKNLTHICLYELDSYEIIGNIYENPELL